MLELPVWALGASEQHQLITALARWVLWDDDIASQILVTSAVINRVRGIDIGYIWGEIWGWWW